MHFEGECMLVGREPSFLNYCPRASLKPRQNILPSPSWNLNYFWAASPLQTQHPYPSLYISISCTSINLHRSWEDKIFTIKKSGCKKHLSKCSLQSLYPKNAPPKNFPTKKIGQNRRSSSSKATFCGSISIFTTGIRGVSRGREPSSGTRTSLATQASDVTLVVEPTHSPKNMRPKMGKIPPLGRGWTW